MTIDIKALRKQLPSFDFIVYTNRTELEPVADGDYVLAADAHELLEAAADRIAALEAEIKRLRARQAPLNGTINKLRRENKRLTGHLRVIATTNQGLGVARRYAEKALASGGDK